MKLIIALTLAILASSQAMELGIRRYDGYQVLSVHSTTKEQYMVLFDIYSKSVGEYDFWTDPHFNGVTDVMVGPEVRPGFEALLKEHGMTFTVKIADVQAIINEEKAQNELARTRAGTGKIDWEQYATYDEIATFVNELPSINNIATVEVFGQSTENRDLHAVKISTGPNNQRAVFIDANIHSREWITSATATWILNEIVNNTDAHGELLDGIDYYIVPMINPDGYEWSRTRDRMWRKTRSVNSGSTCRGCDPNRNFAYFWGGESTSSDPCSDLFKGPAAFSEPETSALADYIERLQGEGVNLLAYISFHSYGQLWLLPWGYTAGAYPPDYQEQLSLGQAVLNAIRGVHNTQYVTGTGADVLYGVGGASDDYAKSVGIKYTVTAEMRDEGRYGFVLPPAQIIPNAEEIMAGLKVVAGRIRSEKV